MTKVLFLEGKIGLLNNRIVEVEKEPLLLLRENKDLLGTKPIDNLVDAKLLLMKAEGLLTETINHYEEQAKENTYEI